MILMHRTPWYATLGTQTFNRHIDSMYVFGNSIILILKDSRFYVEKHRGQTHKLYISLIILVLFLWPVLLTQLAYIEPILLISKQLQNALKYPPLKSSPLGVRRKRPPYRVFFVVNSANPMLLYFSYVMFWHLDSRFGMILAILYRAGLPRQRGLCVGKWRMARIRWGQVISLAHEYPCLALAWLLRCFGTGYRVRDQWLFRRALWRILRAS